MDTLLELGDKLVDSHKRIVYEVTEISVNGIKLTELSPVPEQVTESGDAATAEAGP